MTSILFLTDGIYCNIFRWNYMRKEKLFLIFYLFFFLRFLNLNSIFNVFKEKVNLIADVFLDLQPPKDVVS